MEIQVTTRAVGISHLKLVYRIHVYMDLDVSIDVCPRFLYD